ncbi:MAG: hypothetical protein H0V44_05120 [Planctomycetes bacterium]|nr:hypothetical protein [Planctomycetota bacterium]
MLTRIMRRSTEALLTAPVMQDYLIAAGVPDRRVWSEFHLGAGSDQITAELTEGDWSALAVLGLVSPPSRKLGMAWATGMNLPTYDPRDPERVVGVVRLTPAQNHHRFITRHVGLACGADIASASRVVLADVPLLGLRLANYGVAGVAIVEDTAVLPPLVDWLHGRELVIAGFRSASRAAIRAALGPLGAHAQEVMVLPEIERSPISSKELLGFGVVPKQEPLGLHLLRDLHRYARVRIGVGDGAAALRTLGIDDARFIETCSIGYLPPDYHRALSSDQQRIIGDRVPGHVLVVPALDADATVVDCMLVRVSDGSVIPTVHDAPRGLIAARVATSYDAIIVVDSLQDAADLAVEGHRNVLLLRGTEDAKANAARIAASGVRAADVRCERQRPEIASLLRDAGIVIGPIAAEEPVVLAFPTLVVSNASVGAVPSAETSAVAEPAASPLILVDHDQRTEQATFSADDITYSCEVPWDERTRVGIRIVRGGHEHPDRIDLAEDAQRRRCASSAALRVGAAASVIETHLAQLHRGIRELVERASASSRSVAKLTSMSDTDRASALAFAKQPRLLDRIASDLDTLGWIGEDTAKRFTILAALSRLHDHPVWVSLTTSTDGDRSAGIDAITAITPPEHLIHVSRLTDNTFTYADPTSLRHKLLVIDDASAITAGVATALRVLRRRGAISAPRVERDPVRGDIRTTFVEIHGPIAVFTACSGEIDQRIQPLMVAVESDESPEHIERILSDRRRRIAQAPGHLDSQCEALVARLRNFQRVLMARRVTVPFAERIQGFGTSPRARRDHETLLALIASHALLHQHQRPDLGGSVVATAEDFTVATALMQERLVIEQAELGQHARRLLLAITSAQVSSFTMQDLGRLLPEWNRHSFRNGLSELMALDYLVSPRGGRGAARIYHVTGSLGGPMAPISRIFLQPVGELAEVGGSESANVTLRQDTG